MDRTNQSCAECPPNRYWIDWVFRFAPHAAVVILTMVFGLFAAVAQLSATSPIGPDGDRPLKKPNIIILFSDDAGFADFGFQPDAQKDLAKLTPNIDLIASRGARFTNAYMSGCVCSPSRAGLLSGRYQGRFGHDNNIPPGYMRGGLSLDQTLISNRLQLLGYRTGLVGKWHLGYPAAYHPNERGFDWFYGCLQGSRSYFPMSEAGVAKNPHRVFLENNEVTKEEGYTTDRIGDAACRFIREHHETEFFLFVSFTAPHGPLQPKEADLRADQIQKIGTLKRRKYAGLIKSLDDNVGKILDELKAQQIADSTVVLFTNDNGGQTKTGANNFPLRGGKGSLFEGGVRVPWAMCWPGVIEPQTVIEDPVIALDLMPTLVGMAGGEVQPEWKLDGIDLGPLLRGKQQRLPERTLFWRQHGGQGDIACRQGNWKWILRRSNGAERAELYDLSADISESNDVGSANNEIVEQLAKEVQQWETELVRPLWGPGSPQR